MAFDISNVISSSDQMKLNHEQFKEKFKDANADLVNAQTFLNLLVAEMTNQDPLEPTSNTEFITQMAQFSQLQYLQDTSSYSMSNYASSLVGKTVTVSKMDGTEKVTKTGVVSEVKKVGDEFQLVVDGISFKLNAVQNITETATNTEPGVTEKPTDNTNIGELIAKASQMIGLYATVNTGSSDAEKYVSGFIEAVQAIDGKVKISMYGESYDLDSIVEVIYAVPVDPGEEPGDTVEGDTDTDDIEGVDTENKELDADTAAAQGAGEMLHEVRTIDPENAAEDLEDLSAADIGEEI